MQKKVTIDCFGNRNDLSPERFNNVRGEKRPCLLDTRENVTYMAFARASDGPQPIHKIIVVDKNVTMILWAYGEWNNREHLAYENGPQDTMTITVEE